MWYNKESKDRGYTVTFPDGIMITASDADKSPVNGWEWNIEPPAWWVELNPLQNEI